MPERYKDLLIEERLDTGNNNYEKLRRAQIRPEHTVIENGIVKNFYFINYN